MAPSRNRIEQRGKNRMAIADKRFRPITNYRADDRECLRTNEEVLTFWSAATWRRFSLTEPELKLRNSEGSQAKAATSRRTALHN